ncbi:MAG: hypothetical protein LBK04_00615 [Clostridiales Family XIII bacterium]|nr:hypothetical protein [Clostridiales Family XIII bacterium]
MYYKKIISIISILALLFSIGFPIYASEAATGHSQGVAVPEIPDPPAVADGPETTDESEEAGGPDAADGPEATGKPDENIAVPGEPEKPETPLEALSGKAEGMEALILPLAPTPIFTLGAEPGWQVYSGAPITSGAMLQAAIDAADTTPTHITLTQDIVSPDHINIGSAGKNQTIKIDGADAMRTITAQRSVTNWGAVIDVLDGSTFYMDNLRLTGGYHPIQQGGGVRIGYGGSGGATFVMYSGEIVDNYGGMGGGVSVYKGNTFDLIGGSIGMPGHGNDAAAGSGNDPFGGTPISGCGGGVYVDAGGTFNMSGGSVQHNNDNPGSIGEGDGVFVNGGTFNMTGGKVTHNGVASNSNGRGGVVLRNKGSMNMSGGSEISHNQSNGYGGVAVIDDSVFNMWAGKICNNDGFYGGAVQVGTAADSSSSVFNMYGGVIGGDSYAEGNLSPRAAVQLGAGAWGLEGGTFNMYGGRISYNDLSISGNYAGDGYSGVFAESGVINIVGDAEISHNVGQLGAGVCINNGTLNIGENSKITYNNASARGGGAYAYSTAAINLSGNAQIVNNTSAGDGGGIVLQGSSTATIADNAQVAGNSSKGSGGGVRLVGTSAVKVTGGTITGNSAAGNGGGIYSSASNTVTISGGAISGNTAGRNGGGVQSAGSSVTTISGGDISGNTGGGNGGGVWIGRSAKIELAGGNIANNKATLDGGGVFLEQASGAFSAANLSVTGTAAFSGNRARDSHLPYAMPPAGTWTGGVAPLSIDAPNVVLTSTQQGLREANGNNYMVFNNYDINSAKESKVHTLYYSVAGPESSAENLNVGAYVEEDDDVTVNGAAFLPSSATHDFSGWDVSVNRANVAYGQGEAVNKVAGDIYLYDIWAPKPSYTVSFLPGAHGSFAAAAYTVISGGATPAAPVPTGHDGWKFTGWSPVPATTVTANATYIAQWEQVVIPPPGGGDKPGGDKPGGNTGGGKNDGGANTGNASNSDGNTGGNNSGAGSTANVGKAVTAPSKTKPQIGRKSESPKPSPYIAEGFSEKEAAMIEAQTGNPLADIINGNVPSGNFKTTAVWSLLNLILVCISLLAALVLAIGFTNPRYRIAGLMFLRSVAIAIALITFVVWAILEKLRNPVAWVNTNTPVILLLFGFLVAATAVFMIVRSRIQVRDGDGQEAS